VGAFDTGQAARVLEMPSFSLAHLLKAYCGVSANKAYQMADWRIRPLTDEMVTYARQDTHYLLFIADKLKLELAASGRDAAVWQRSAEVCRQAYKVVPFSDDDYGVLLRRQNAGQLLPPQVSAHRALFRWRDSLAREEDESCAYVLPNHLLLKLSLALPRTAEQLKMICHPMPPLLNYHTASLLGAIAAALEDGAAPAATPSATPYVSPAVSLAGSQVGALPPSTDASFDGGLPWPSTLHPMQPSLANLAASPGGPPPPSPASVAMPPPPQQQPGGARGRRGSPQQRRGATPDGSTSVRQPPTPSRSPPLHVDHLYEAAGWVSRGAGEIASSLLPGGGRQGAMIAPGGAPGGGLFEGWSDGSSSEDDKEAATAQGIQAQLSISPLWVLDMFAPPARADEAVAAHNANGADADDAQSKHGAPRSLNEIYKLSNLNKRRGATVGRRTDAVGGGSVGGEGAAGSDSEGGGAEEGGGEESDDESGGEEEEEAHSKRRKGGGAGDSDGWAANQGKERTEEFMRRIGWLRPDASLSSADAERSERASGGGRGFDGAASNDGSVGGGEGGGAGGAMELLPYQRQQMSLSMGQSMPLPPHMSGGPQPSAQQAAPNLVPNMMPQPPQQMGPPGAMPHSMGRPAPPPQDEAGRGKASKARHKKRTGFGGETGFETTVDPSAFVYNMAVQPQGGKGGGKGKGKGAGGKGFGGRSGGKGMRSMSFGPAAGGRGGY